MITNPPPKSQTLKMLGIVCSVIGTCFKLKSGSIVGGGWGGWCNEGLQLRMFVFVRPGLREAPCVSESSLLSLWM